MDNSPEFVNEHVLGFLEKSSPGSHASYGVICDDVAEKADPASVWPTTK